jgi:hypothetical protein
MWVGAMKILKLLMIIRIFSNNSLSGLDEQDNGFKNQVFLKAFVGNGMGKILPDETDKNKIGEWRE